MVWGRYKDYTDVVDSAVFQRTDEFDIIPFRVSNTC